MAKDPLKALLNAAPGNLTRAQRRNASRYLKDEMRKVENITTADMMSGAGYPIDQGLRKLLKACNDELMEGTNPPFRNIWDVFSGFVTVEKANIVQYLRLRQEKDHAFTQMDFFGFAPDEGLREQTFPRLKELPEGVVHNYSGAADREKISFTLDSGETAMMSGISFVRHGGHLHWVAIGGPILDLEAVTAERRQMLAEREEQIRRANPGASELKIQDTLNPTAIPLPGTDDVWLTYVMGLFNLETRSHEIRIVVRDWGVTLSVFSDQFEQLNAEKYETDPQIRRVVDKAMVEIENGSVMFEVSETLFALPAYFATRVLLTTSREVRTKLGSGSPEARHALKAPPDMRILTKHVSTLDFGAPREGAERSYTPPRFRVELDGYWRRISPDSMGRDSNGNPVQGRTWVRGHMRWKDRPPKLGVIHVKSPISSALEKANTAVSKRGGSVEIRY